MAGGEFSMAGAFCAMERTPHSMAEAFHSMAGSGHSME
jgi:hypothetical protein